METAEGIATFFRQHSYVPLGRLLSDQELEHFSRLYDEDHGEHGGTATVDQSNSFSWRAQGIQHRQYEVLVTSPGFDVSPHPPSPLPHHHHPTLLTPHPADPLPGAGAAPENRGGGGGRPRRAGLLRRDLCCPHGQLARAGTHHSRAVSPPWCSFA